MLNELLKRYPCLESTREDILKAEKALITAFKNGNKLLICGNGGSCADCEHIVGEPDIVKDSFNTLPDTPSADNSDTGSQSGPSASQSGPAGNPESSGENAGTQSLPDSAEPTGPQTDDGTEVTDSAENKESAAEAEESDGTEVSENGGVSAAIIITAVSVIAAAALAAGAILLYRFKRRKKEQ